MSSFYRMFSAYYNTIFPFAGGKEEFVKKLLAKYKPKTALDLGCASGQLTAFLNRHGCTTIGVDLSPDLLNLAKRGPGEYVLADMVKYLEQDPVPKDMLVCIGNTLPHLIPPQRRQFLKLIPEWLSDGGALIIQTVNYAKILAEKSPGLPTIEKPEIGIRFTRLYTHKPDGSIDFTAILNSPEGSSQDTVTLWPFTAKELHDELPASLQVTEELGGFSGIPYGQESGAWVMTAQKLTKIAGRRK